MAELDEEELVEREQSEVFEEEQRRQEWEAQQQQERLQRMRQSQKPENRTEKAADTAKKAQKWVKRYEKIAAVVEFLAASFPIWGPILGVLIAVMFVIVVLIAGCNQTGLSGKVARSVSAFGGFFGTDVCKSLSFNGGTSGGAGGGASFGNLTDAQARAQLAAAGIQVNAPQPQTSLEGISQAVLTEIINFADSCSKSVNPNAGPNSNSCGVVFTGGTETNAGHEGGPCSHLSGNKADIRAIGAVNSYIQNQANFTRIQTRSDGAAQYQSKATGVIYARESDHWDLGGVGC